MSELLAPAHAHAAGLAGLLAALRPRAEPVDAPPPPDLDAIRAAGWDDGFTAGEAAATAALSPLRVQLAEAAAALDAACRIDVDALRPLFVTLIRQIAEAVLMAELGASAATLEPLVNAALTAVHAGEAPTLRAHPETLAALGPHLPDVATHADPGLARDAFSVCAPQFRIDVGLSARLAAVTGAMA
jgi:flagellar biosynthesis/type III secretory pathway protein FliH